MLTERAAHDKQAKQFAKQRAVMAGWQYSLAFGAPVFKVINQVRGKKPEVTSGHGSGMQWVGSAPAALGYV